MTEKDIRKRAVSEKKKLKKLLIAAGTPEERLKIFEPVLDNVSWMKIKLDEAREQIKEENITVEYDNGGGQRGVRENPMFKGYEALWKTYMSGLSSLISGLPESKAALIEESEKPQSMLELIRAKKCKEA